MFLSLVIAPNVNYRALNRLPDQRRFNVAMSRARDQVWLFHSVQLSDLSPDDLRHRLINFFENPQNAAADTLAENLERLERAARSPRRRGTQPEPYESWFEVDVALELLRRKFRVRPQVDVAGYRIDLVVEGSSSRLAVECDGDEWQGPDRYEQDMARQRILERAGWTFVRLRESDFYVDRERTMAAVFRACEELGIRPAEFVDESKHGSPTALAPDGSSATAVLEETAVASLDPGEEVVETDASSSIIRPSTEHSKASGFPDPRQAPVAKVREALRRLIEQHGPLTRGSVYRLYVEGCPGLQRVGKTVREALDRALGAMLRAGEIVEEDELGDGSPEGRVVRIAGTPAVKVRPAGTRDLLDIPPSELLEVLRIRHRAETLANEDKDALFRTIFEHYGFTRLTQARKEYLLKVIQRGSSFEGDKI
jgi:very-short-patch-repair endonuclease